MLIEMPFVVTSIVQVGQSFVNKCFDTLVKQEFRKKKKHQNKPLDDIFIYWCRLFMQLKYDIIIESNTRTKFATHLATLHLETPDFIRPQISHMINGGEDL